MFPVQDIARPFLTGFALLVDDVDQFTAIFGLGLLVTVLVAAFLKSESP